MDINKLGKTTKTLETTDFEAFLLKTFSDTFHITGVD
jgi:hypothetical protein